MSEENTTDTESETPEISSTENFINAVTAKDYVAASKEFEDIILNKIDNSMEQEKINLAGQIFNGEEAPEDEDEDHIENDYEEDETEEEDEEDMDGGEYGEEEEEEFDDEEDIDDDEEEDTTSS